MPTLLPPRWSGFLHRAFDRRRGQPIQLLDDVLPTAPVLDPAGFPHMLRRGEVPWYFGVSVLAPGVGQYAWVDLTSSPGYFTVIEGVWVTWAIGQTFWGTVFSSAPPNRQRGGIVRRDCRGMTGAAGINPPAAQWYVSSDAVAPTAQGLHQYVPANQPLLPIVGTPIVVDDTSYLRVKANSTNEAFRLVAVGYDVPVENQADAGP